jgi:hypothetical protein
VHVQVVGQSGVVNALIGSLEYVSDNDIAGPLTFISALIVSPSAKQFAVQFVEAGGASEAAVARCARAMTLHVPSVLAKAQPR